MKKTKQTIQYIFLTAICLTFVHTYQRKSLMSESIIHPVIIYSLFTYQHTSIEPRLSCSVFFCLVFVSLAVQEYFFQNFKQYVKVNGIIANESMHQCSEKVILHIIRSVFLYGIWETLVWMLWGSVSISQAVQFLSSFEGEQNDDKGISIHFFKFTHAHQ